MRSYYLNALKARIEIRKQARDKILKEQSKNVNESKYFKNSKKNKCKAGH